VHDRLNQNDVTNKVDVEDADAVRDAVRRTDEQVASETGSTPGPSPRTPTDAMGSNKRQH
jgi:hypothetical protein